MHFRVLIHGTNLITNIDNVPTRVGFYTTRFVDASDQSEAEARAIIMVEKDDQLKIMTLNNAADPPKIFVEETEITNDSLSNNVGYTFYRE